MKERYYIEVDGKPVPTEDQEAVNAMIGSPHRTVAKTLLHDDTVEVSTVFLVLNHAFDGGTPVLYETLVFGGPLDGDGTRYCFRDEAFEGHQEWVRKAADAKPTEEDPNA